MFNKKLKTILTLIILSTNSSLMAGGEGGGGGGSSSGGGGKVVIGKNSFSISINGGDGGGGGGPRTITNIEGFGGDGCGGGGPMLARLMEENINDFSQENSYLILKTSNESILKIPTSDTLRIENALNDISHNNIIIKAFSIK